MKKVGRAEMLTNIPAREDLKNVLEKAGFEVSEAEERLSDVQTTKFSNLAAMLTEIVIGLSEEEKAETGLSTGSS